MSTTPGSIEDVLDRALSISDPEKRLRAISALDAQIPALAARVRSARAQALRDLNDSGRTWAEIGTILGVTRQRAHNMSTLTKETSQ